MAKKAISSLQTIGGHIKVHISVRPKHQRIIDIIFDLTHKKRSVQKHVSLFVAGGSTIDKKIEQANKSVAKKSKAQR